MGRLYARGYLLLLRANVFVYLPALYLAVLHPIANRNSHSLLLSLYCGLLWMGIGEETGVRTPAYDPRLTVASACPLSPAFLPVCGSFSYLEICQSHCSSFCLSCCNLGALMCFGVARTCGVLVPYYAVVVTLCFVCRCCRPCCFVVIFWLLPTMIHSILVLLRIDPTTVCAVQRVHVLRILVSVFPFLIV